MTGDSGPAEHHVGQPMGTVAGRSRRQVGLIALDLDGTILEDGSMIQPEVVTAVRTCRAAGIKIVTASGRPYGFQLAKIREYDLARDGFDGLICDERELYLADISGDQASPFVPVPSWNDHVHARWRRLVPDVVRWVAWCLDQAAQDGWFARKHLSDTEIAARGFGVLALDTEGHAAQLLQNLALHLRDSDPRLSCNRNQTLVQICDASVDKGRSLLRLAGDLHVPSDEVLAIGDSENDCSMLDGRYGFQAATVANAAPEATAAVERCGGVISNLAMGAGVVEILGLACVGN